MKSAKGNSRKSKLCLLAVTLSALCAGTPPRTAGALQSVPGAPAAQQGQRQKREYNTEHRRQVRAALQAAHTDRRGRPRPDLWLESVRHIKRMQVQTRPSPSRPARGALEELTRPTRARFVPAAARDEEGAANGLAPHGAAAPPPAPQAELRWTQLGPAPLYDGGGTYHAGEVVGLAIDPRGGSDEVIYAATGFGGVWKSTNGGWAWSPLTDDMPSLAMGAVALDPSNPDIVYAGTGNNFDSLGSFPNTCLGIYKSVAGGQPGTWRELGGDVFGPAAAVPNQRIYRIVVPTSGVVLVATNMGLYRSADGGLNFGANAPRFDNRSPIIPGNVYDLDLDTSSRRIAYASVAGVGVLKSVDMGVTFSENLFRGSDGRTRAGAPTAAQFGVVSFAQSTRPDNRTLYASVGNPDGGAYYGLYRSRDGGTTWARVSGADRIEFGGNGVVYNHVLGVHPSDARNVYLGFAFLYFSTDGGESFKQAGPGVVHADNHDVAFSPLGHANKAAYVGTDGGIFATADGLRWSDRNKSLAVSLITQIGIGIADDRYMYAGLWDMGGLTRRTADDAGLWYLGQGYNYGDGGAVAVDPSDSAVGYQAGNFRLVRTTDGGRTWPPYTGTTPPPDFYNRLAFTAVRDRGRIYRKDFYAVKGAALFGGGGSVIKTFQANVNSIATTLADAETMWVGLFDGSVWRTSNLSSGAGAVWTNLGSPGGNKAVSVAIDPADRNTAVAAYVGFTGIGPSNRTQHVFLMRNNGGVWTDISGVDNGDPTTNLPDAPVYSVVIDPNTSPRSIIVGTSAGVLASDGGGTWRVLGQGLPKVACPSLAINTERNPSLLRVGTFGRSVFELTAR